MARAPEGMGGGSGGAGTGAGGDPGPGSAASAVAGSREEARQLDRVLADLYGALLEFFPEFATRTGDHRFDDRLSDPGPAGHARYEALIRAYRDKVLAIDPARLPAGRATTWELARFWLEGEAEGFQFDEHLLLLIDPLQGLQISLPNLLNDMPCATADDYRRALDRLDRVPEYIGLTIEGTREGLRRGAAQARPAVEKVLDQVRGQAASRPEAHPFFRLFDKMPPGIPEREREELREAARRGIETRVIPALARFADHLAAEYLPRARPEAGVWAIPRGRDLYAWLVRQSTTTDLSPDDIHRLGLSEVERIRGEMEAVKAAAGFGDTLEEFFAFLRASERFYFRRAEDLLAGYRDIAKRADAELPRFFGQLPRTPYGVLPIPDYAAPAAPAAYYQPPPADGSRPGIFYANVFDLPSRPRYEMEALTLHESVPGHHLQLALQIEIRGLPEFRTRWLTFTAFVEGWGLYAERLGKEMGFYSDPYAEFGRLMYEVWRACRLVVDTGIHHLGWTRERAVEYMRANSSLTVLNIASEVDRYIVWPGQALAYKIGELRIRELRRRAEEALGPRFDIRAFHDRLLEQGSLPLAVLEKGVDDWIRASKRRRSPRARPGAGRPVEPPPGSA